MSNCMKTAVSATQNRNNNNDVAQNEKEKKKSDKSATASSKTKSKGKSKEKSKSSAPIPIPTPKKSSSPAPSKSPSKGPPKAGGNRSSLRLPRLNRSATSLGSAGGSNLARCRSAASSPCSSKRSLVTITPRFPTANIPIPVPDVPKSAQVRMRNTVSESSPVVNGHARLSYNEGVFAPGLANTSRRRPEFVIHPEWASEVVGADKLPPLPHPFRTKYLNSDSAASSTSAPSVWPKRCKSAPPPNYRNPITWE